MADLTRNVFDTVHKIADIDALLVAAAAGQTVPEVDGKDFLIVKNGDASPHDLTLEEAEVCNFGHPATDQTITIAAGKYAIITPANYVRFRDSTTKKMSLTWSALTSMSVGLFKWPK